MAVVLDLGALYLVCAKGPAKQVFSPVYCLKFHKKCTHFRGEKTRLRETNGFAQGLTARKFQCRALSPD